MISSGIFIVLLIFGIVLAILAIIWNRGFHSLLALVLSSLILWMLTIAQASGSVGTQQMIMSSSSVVDTVTTYTHELIQVPILDSVLTGILIIISVIASIYSAYVAVVLFVDIFREEV